mgnify:CR=1 FL=1
MVIILPPTSQPIAFYDFMESMQSCLSTNNEACEIMVLIADITILAFLMPDLKDMVKDIVNAIRSKKKILQNRNIIPVQTLKGLIRGLERKAYKPQLNSISRPKMPFEVAPQKLVIQDEAEQNKVELDLPVSKQQLISSAIEVARKAGYSKFVLKTSSGQTWENPSDVPETVSDPLVITVVPLNKGA